MPTKKQNRRIARFELAQSTRAAPTPPEVKPPWASIYTPAIGERICDLVTNGKTLRQIALEEVWAPNARIMYYWLEEHP